MRVGSAPIACHRATQLSEGFIIAAILPTGMRWASASVAGQERTPSGDGAPVKIGGGALEHLLAVPLQLQARNVVVAVAQPLCRQGEWA